MKGKTMKRAVLVNIHGDNFGDDINALAARRYCRDYLGLSLSAALCRPAPWRSVVSTRDLGVVAQRLPRMSCLRIDYLFHVCRIPHICSNAEQWRRIETAILASDLVVSVPAGAGLGPYRDHASLVPLLIARRTNTPRALLFATIQPSGSWLFDRLLRHAIKGAQLSIRGPSSASYLRGLGLPFVGPMDLTLAEVMRIWQELLAARRDVITLVLGDIMWWHPNAGVLKARDHSPAISDAVLEAALAAPGFNALRIELVPHSTHVTELAHLRQVRESCSEPDRVTVRDDITSAHDYIAAIGSSYLVVSLRYHGFLSAVATGAPVVGIAYEAKTVDLREMLGINAPPVIDLRSERPLDFEAQVQDAMSTAVATAALGLEGLSEGNMMLREFASLTIREALDDSRPGPEPSRRGAS